MLRYARISPANAPGYIGKWQPRPWHRLSRQRRAGWQIDTKLLLWSTTLPASERLPVAAAFARGDTSRAGLRERVPAPPRVGLFEVVVILALAVVLGVGMLLGLELGALLALLPR
jgi:hypothetical protein